MLFALALLFVQTSHANFVSYVDENGTRHIVQSQEEIPEKYRDTAKTSSAGNPDNAVAGGGGAQASGNSGGNKQHIGRRGKKGRILSSEGNGGDQ